MKYRVFAAFILGIMVLNLGGSSFADTRARQGRATVLVSLLPASDGVATFNVKRFFGEVLPQVLANNQPMLAKMTGKIDELQTKIGIDVRQFDEMAVGVSIRQLGVKNYDIDPVVIARGQMGSAALIGAAKLAANSKYREERISGRVIYVFDGKVMQKSPSATASLTEIGLTAIDDRTVAFGEVGRVRQTVEAKTRVGAELAAMLSRNPAALASFAAKTPVGLKAYLPLENDELGKNIDSIRYVYGSADVTAGVAAIQVTARTMQNAQAASLHDTLKGLQMLGKAFLGGAQSGNRAVYGRLIDNAKFSTRANEVMVELSVPQSDIDVLVSGLK